MRNLLFSILIVFSSSAAAETWIVGSMEGFAPFNFTVAGEYSGIDVEIIDEAAKRIGVSLDHRPMPWKRALLDFEAGNLDAVFQLTPTDERYVKWNMVGPLRTTRTVIVVMAESPLRDVSNLDDLQNLIVGVVDGFTYDAEFDESDWIDKELSSDDFANVRKLLLGRVDVVVGGHATLAFVARELNAQDKLRVLPTPLVEHARYIAFARTPGGDDKASRFQDVLETMHSSGRISEIIQTYVEQ